MKLHSYKWNEHSKEYTTVILTTEDIHNENFRDLIGAGFEILILPVAYKETKIKQITTAIMLAKARKGEVLYV